VLIALETEFPKQLAVICRVTNRLRWPKRSKRKTPEEAANVRARAPANDGVAARSRCEARRDHAGRLPVRRRSRDIPVGGGIEVENAIIPGAHSADICCSMFATFFPANHPVGAMMDHLHKTTHFGPGGRPFGRSM